MCQVTTTWEVETHDAVMGIEQSCVDCKVGWTAASIEAKLEMKGSTQDNVKLPTCRSMAARSQSSVVGPSGKLARLWLCKDSQSCRCSRCLRSTVRPADPLSTCL